ncbi:hypothetical protein H6802_00910 [Candidatus Nomurabacteria bacterium]|uniref:R3H domain-containing protein n=1 Tax=candidate division WWE3 bacterium TaxID=2053526 RepID=A0A955E1B2_UNCKA|nr:hypothetical protein [candidate division WWE3 bacterium]MCB9823504.1 hypothetical protein [Candidatus Nomurabacteria bacterium]MCB9827786.1 hypothetical protein [Candidatus Nomurabacteria bacterium]HXK52391.1 R3H domain-containing nucleic acid-binding protein [bacterium]
MNKDQFITQYMKDVLNHLNVATVVNIDVAEDSVKVVLTGDDLNFLIGFRGTSLDALQALLALSLYNKYEEWFNVFVDINGYKEKRFERLEDLAKKAIDKVRFFSKEVALPPMNSFERKYIHEFVSSYDDMQTESTGEGSERHIVVSSS